MGSYKSLVLDPGHGGEYSGAVAYPPVYEKDLNLEYSRAISLAATRMGVESDLTRHKDVTLHNSARPEKADPKHTQAFVSIHFNSFPSTEARGLEIFHHDPESKALAEKVLKQLTPLYEEWGIPLRQPAIKKDMDVQPKGFVVLRKARVPAILIEGGFMSNPVDLKAIMNPKFKEEFSEAVATAILTFISSL